MVLFGAATTLGGASMARAQATDQAAAEQVFDEANRLADAGRFEEACPKFAASHRLDPGYGAVFNLADCHERTGKTASAWAAFREAAATAQRAGDEGRVKKAEGRAARLEPRLTRMRILVDRAEPGMDVRRDGVAIDAATWGSPVPVDPGAHVVTASAPGRRPWTTTVTASGDGRVVLVQVPLLVADAAAGAPRPREGAPPAPAEEGSFPVQRGIALGAGAVGVAGLVVGSVLGLGARSKWDEAQSGHCNSEDQCDGTGLSLVEDAKSAAGASTVGFVVGAAGLASGVALWLTAPAGSPKSASVTPFVGVGVAGFVALGRF